MPSEKLTPTMRVMLEAVADGTVRHLRGPARKRATLRALERRGLVQFVANPGGPERYRVVILEQAIELMRQLTSPRAADAEETKPNE